MKVIEGIGVNGEMELNKKKKNIIGMVVAVAVLASICLFTKISVKKRGDES